METINIIINQTGKPAGVAGQSRDDLALYIQVVLSNYNPTQLEIETYLWELISVPETSLTTILFPSSNISGFVPDVVGSYLVQLTANTRVSKRIIATIKTASLGLHLVADKESREFDGWSNELNDSLQKLERNSCGAACTGFCLNNCLSSCAGSCTGDCASSCSNSCAGSCSSTCAGSSS